MLEKILTQIENSRYRLYAIDPVKKEKLLQESRMLDLLILEYYKYITTAENIKKPRS